MSRNRIKSANNLQPRKIWIAVTVVFILTLFGFVYVSLQLKNTRLAEDSKKLEMELTKLKLKNDMLALQKQGLLNAPALEKRLAYYKIEMISPKPGQVIDARSFHAAGEGSLMARGRNYP